MTHIVHDSIKIYFVWSCLFIWLFLFSFRRMSRRKIRPLWKTMHERPFPKKDLKVISLSSSSFLDVLAQSICFSRWQEPNSSAVELSSDVDRQVPKHAQHRRTPSLSVSLSLAHGLHCFVYSSSLHLFVKLLLLNLCQLLKKNKQIQFIA